MIGIKVNKILTAAVLLLPLLFISCGGSTNHLAAGTLSGKDTYKINSYYGCCGCYAKYAAFYTGKKIKEQIIYDYSCSGNVVTKYIFIYAKGTLQSGQKYVATAAEDYTLRLTEDERSIFKKLDSDSLVRMLPKDKRFNSFSSIRGFRKAKDGEMPHSFPLIKHGVKLRVE